MKIVYIEWIDASAVEKYHKDVAMPKDQEVALQNNYSVGIVLKDTGEYISLAQSLSANGWYRDIISIPRVSIKVEKVLMEI